MTTSFLTESQSPSRIAFSWLLHLRWGALAGQALIIFLVYIFFEINIPIPTVAALILFGAGSNLFFYFLIQKKSVISDWLTGVVMFLDIILLTVLLSQTGGPMNPFTFLYLVHVALGSILMKARWSWALTVFAILCYASVFYIPASLHFLHNPEVTGELCHDPALVSHDMTLHLQGMWVAFAVTALFIVFFVGKTQKALDEHQETIARLREEKNKNEKLAALATLSAGAAHEFSTPLSTIAVAAGEMLHHLKNNQGDQELIDDTKLIRSQVDRCKEILYHLAADAGNPLGEALEESSTDKLINNILMQFPDKIRERIVYHNQTMNALFHFPQRTLIRTIKGLLKNALDAAEDNSSIILTSRRDAVYLYFEVEDQGVGMDQEIIAKATEPFFTTKETGKGMGLGLFLTKLVAERLGGSVEIYSQKNKGTKAVLKLALNKLDPL
ncbi:MAG: ATP-binding protein [Proteobacteria bacterium]|nr:ATP-binding protein [Pseudomonadota bacterium]MBU1709518.1 ATP-binding protein [Pseudomonadota bacterium]